MLIILIGPKGSGKTFVGQIFQQRLGITFVPVECIWMDYLTSCRRDQIQSSIAGGLERVESALATAILESRHVVFETTAATAELREFVDRISHGHPTMLCRIQASMETCLRRIADRDSREHLDVDEEIIHTIFKISETLNLDFDIELKNEALTEEQIVAAFESLLDAAS